MDINDFQEFLKDEGNKKVFADVAKTLGYETPEEIQGLKAKNYELLGNNKKLKEQINEIQKKLDGIDIDSYNDYVNKISTSGKPDDEITKLKRELQTAIKQNEEYKSKYSALEAELNSSVVNSTLSSVFDEIGIDPKHKALLLEAYRGKAKIETTDSGRTVVIDSGDSLGLPAIDYFKKFAESETGKHYLKQPENSGANSSRFTQPASGQKITQTDFNKLLPKQQAEFMNKGGTII